MRSRASGYARKGPTIQYLLYRSLTDLTPVDAGYRHILARSRARNGDLEMTGYLHWEDGIFHQWIEGPGDKLRSVEAIIFADRMHRDVTVLDRGEARVREFEEWSMASSTSETCSLFSFMASSEIGRRDPSAHAKAVLQFMKEQLRRDADLRAAIL